MDVEETILKIIRKTGLSREEIQQKIDQQIKDLSGLIDEEGALVVVAKYLNVDLKENQDEASMEVDILIKDIKPQSNVNIVGRIIQIGTLRTFARKDGSQGSMFWFYIKDVSGTIRVVVWDPNSIIINEPTFQIDEIVRIINGYAKIGRNGNLEVNVGSKSRIILQPDEIDMKNIPPKQGNSLILTSLGNLTLKEPFLNVEGIIKRIFPVKTFSKKAGGEGLRSSMVLADDSGECFIIFWDAQTNLMNNLREGMKIKMTNLIPKTNYRDNTKIDLTATSNTEIDIVEENAISSLNNNSNYNSSTGNSNIDFAPSKSITQAISEGGLVSLEGVVQEVSNIRTITLKDGSQRDLQSFIIADSTGAIKINLWGESVQPDLALDDVIKLQNVFVKKNNFSGQMEGSLTRNGTFEKIQKDIQPITPSISLQPKASINNNNLNNSQSNQIQNRDLATEPITKISKINQPGIYTIIGTIVKPINRITIYEACSKCMRKITNCTCDTPGETELRLIMNIIIDDESATIRATLMGEIGEKLLNETTDRLHQFQENGEINQYLEDANMELLGRMYYFKGKVRYSDYSKAYEITIFNFQDFEPEKEAQKLAAILQ